MGYPGQPGQLHLPGGGGRLRIGVDVPAADRPGGLRDGARLPQRARPDGRAGVRGGGHVADQARRRRGEHALPLPRLPRQAGRHRGRAVGRAARPRAGPGLDAGGVRRRRRGDGRARRPDGGVHRGDAPLVGGRGGRVQRRVLHPAGRPDGAGAGAAARPPDPARRHGPAGAGTGRAARRRLGDLQPYRPVPDRRGRQDGAGRGGAGWPRPGGDPDHLPGRGPLGRPGDRARRAGGGGRCREASTTSAATPSGWPSRESPRSSTTSTGIRWWARPTPTRPAPPPGPRKSWTGWRPLGLRARHGPPDARAAPAGRVTRLPGGRWPRPRSGWTRRAWPGCWTRARWPSSAR